MTREIALRKGIVTLVDDADYEWLSGFEWLESWGRDSFYAARTETYVRKDGKVGTRSRQMQQDILYPGQKCPKGMKADHCNRNTLDNQRDNLRLISDNISNVNRRLFKNNACGYRGVCFDRFHDYWCVKVTWLGLRHCRGGFRSVEEAARGYNSLARFYHGEHAQFNIIPGGGSQFLDAAILGLGPTRWAEKRALRAAKRMTDRPQQKDDLNL